MINTYIFLSFPGPSWHSNDFVACWENFIKVLGLAHPCVIMKRYDEIRVF